jgi:DNA mismatch repair protein MutL
MIYFVNRRWVMNPSLGHAVMTAYHTLLPTRRFPAAVLFIEMPVDEVDVNVHPTKREVKFAKDRDIYDAIVRAIRGTLLSAPGSAADSPISPAPYTAPETPAGFLNEGQTVPRPSPPQAWGVPGGNPPSARDAYAFRNASHDPAASLESLGLGKGTLQAGRIDPAVPLYNFSQLFNTFIVFQSDSEMYIADQHTVHERLNYEKLMAGVRAKSLEVQPLLVPLPVELTVKEAQILRNNLEALMDLGLEVSPFGGNTFLVRSLPADLSGRNAVNLVKDLVDDLAAQDASGVKSASRTDMARERTATFLSCRSAVMAGDRLNEDQMKGLIERMREANLPFTCPHGRPTILSIPLSELYRRFDRH